MNVLCNIGGERGRSIDKTIHPSERKTNIYGTLEVDGRLGSDDSCPWMSRTGSAGIKGDRISRLFHPNILITHLLTTDPNFLGHSSGPFLAEESVHFRKGGNSSCKLIITTTMGIRLPETNTAETILVDKELLLGRSSGRDGNSFSCSTAFQSSGCVYQYFLFRRGTSPRVPSEA